MSHSCSLLASWPLRVTLCSRWESGLLADQGVSLLLCSTTLIIPRNLSWPSNRNNNILVRKTGQVRQENWQETENFFSRLLTLTDWKQHSAHMSCYLMTMRRIMIMYLMFFYLLSSSTVRTFPSWSFSSKMALCLLSLSLVCRSLWISSFTWDLLSSPASGISRFLSSNFFSTEANLTDNVIKLWGN